MVKTLFIDAGNTRIKAAACNGNQWVAEGSWPYSDPQLKSQLLYLSGSFDRVVLSSVSASMRVDDLQKILAGEDHGNIEILVVGRDSLPGNRIAYRTPETLGVDRYLACLGAWTLSKQEADRPVIVTDTGTACTIDVMDTGGVFRGGVIMPGMQMMMASLAEGADGLFQVDTGLPENWPPDSTEAAIQAGTTGSFLAAWESHTSRSLALFPDADLWVTGGDARFLVSQSKKNCRIHNFLVFEGMKQWLNR